MGAMRSTTQTILQQTLEFSKKRSDDEIIQLTDCFWNYYHDQVELTRERFQLKWIFLLLVSKKFLKS
ncbi:unnamed protein product [Adineta ricciae]|uniref:Uncharacterized protein n=1 Tax=Adineta ricciae TaxID=249248 RepID=A0A814ECA3_ADIRI|nr:unnamed protein product [Adineta ricciae]